MTESELQTLLGSADPDPGCDHSGELMDEYCELLVRGGRLSNRFAEFVTHMANCTACREDMEGLLAVLREQKKTSTG